MQVELTNNQIHEIIPNGNIEFFIKDNIQYALFETDKINFEIFVTDIKSIKSS